MRKGDRAELKMQKVLRTGQVSDDTVYTCVVSAYCAQQESLSLILQSGKLTDLSLDAIYTCEIHTEQEQLRCTGRIRERYCDIEGKILKMKIENGFYKINIK